MEEYKTMNDENTLSANNQKSNTSVINNIPSEVVYDIIVESYSNGHFPSKEEIIAEYARSINPNKDKEIGMITGSCKYCEQNGPFILPGTEETKLEQECEICKNNVFFGPEHDLCRPEEIENTNTAINSIGNAEPHNFVQVEDKETGMNIYICKDCGFKTTFVHEYSRPEEIDVEFEQEMPKFSRR